MGDFSAEFLSSKNVETFLKNLIKFIEEQGMKNKLVELVNISKSFGSTKVLDELCLEVKENEFLTLLGPSGCGKTTTLRIIGGFERPDSGKVLFDGTDITNVPANKRNLNTVFQKYALFGHMTIEENIAFGLKIKNKNKGKGENKWQKTKNLSTMNRGYCREQIHLYAKRMAGIILRHLFQVMTVSHSDAQKLLTVLKMRRKL